MIENLETRLQEISDILQKISQIDKKTYKECLHGFECFECSTTYNVDIKFNYEEPVLSHSELLLEVDRINGIIDDLRSDIDLLKIAERRSA